MIIKFVPNKHWKRSLEDPKKKQATLGEVISDFKNLGTRPVLAAYLPQDWGDERIMGVSVVFKGVVDLELVRVQVQIIGDSKYGVVVLEE